MKEFRKSEQGFLICEECGRIFKNLQGLSNHIISIHYDNEIYFNKFLKEENDNKCKICNKKTEFVSINGYKKCCCKDHEYKYTQLRVEEENIKKYGVKNVYALKEIREKAKRTKKERYNDENFINIEKVKHTKREKYGDENYNNSKKNKQTKKERYGNENYTNREKGKKTCKEKYGVEYPIQNKKIYKKLEQTCLHNNGVTCMLKIRSSIEKTNELKYGVKFPTQNIKIFEKGQKTRYLRHQFRNTDIWYQGSYELDFLEKYYNNIQYIQNGSYIKYIFIGQNKIYYPDFYIPSLNLIVECKNSYLAKKDKDKIEAKKKATISNGFEYIMIVDKDYSDFESLLTNQGTSNL